MDATGDHPEKRWVGVGGRGVVMRWKEGEDLQAKAFVMVSPEGMGEAGSAGLEWAILGDFLRLWGQGVVPFVWNLVLGTSCPEFEPDAGGGWSVGSVFEKHTRGQDSLLLFSRSVVANSLRPHGLQLVRLPCPSLSLGACSDSRSTSQ